VLWAIFERLKWRSLRPQSTALLPRVPDAQGQGYLPVDRLKEIRQGEILGNVRYYYWLQNKDDHTIADSYSKELSYAIVSTPDCDLLQDFKSRRKGLNGTLFSILLFGAEQTDPAKLRTGLGRTDWRLVLQNRMDQYHFLDLSGIPLDNNSELSKGLVVDFKRYFTLTPEELHRQFDNLDSSSRCNRICRLSDLWREDFQRRAMSYMQRVALPDPADADD
jgi:hypothetical protein